MAQEATIIGIARHRIMTDGTGVCTLAAFHACSLHCQYCLNPQSLTGAERFKAYTPQELYDRVKIDQLYFLATGGGVTFGGGEPCLRSDFITEFRRICGHQWKLALETAINVPPANIEQLIPVIDHFYIDIKDMNPAIYKRYTGKDNHLVMENLKILAKTANQVTIRIPLIPNFNTQGNQQRSVEQLKEMGFGQFDLFTYQTNIQKQ